MLLCKKHKLIHFFTIMELLVSMAVFAILVLFLMQVFSSTQTVWTNMSRKTSTQETARVILDLMEHDLQSWSRPDDSATAKGFYVSAPPSSLEDATDNAAKTPLTLMFLTSDSSLEPGKNDLLQSAVRYYVSPLQNSKNKDCRLGCLFRKRFSSTSTEYNNFVTSGSDQSSSDGDLIASNVYSLKVEAFSSSYTSMNGNCSPDYLLVTLRLMDEDVVDVYKDLDLKDDPKDTPKQEKIQLENIHTFKRIIVLN